MVHVRQNADLSDQLLTRSARWYAGHGVPDAFTGLPRPVLDHLIAVTGGDWRRCVVEPDGTVTMYNAPVWARTA